MISKIFFSEANFKKIYIVKLSEMIDQEPTLGTFIIAFSQSNFSKEIYQELKPKLKNLFEKLKIKYKNNYKKDNRDEDLIYFSKIARFDFEKIPKVKFKKIGPWNVQLNELRSYKPHRISKEKITKLIEPFDNEKFNFNRSFLAKEKLFEGSLGDEDLTIFYAKFPPISFHTIWCPNRLKKLSQYLTPKYHFYIWKICQKLSQNLPGIGFGYNSLGAFASINHFHFHGFISEEPRPVTFRTWQHNEGIKEFPTDCKIFNSSEESWKYIKNLHQKNIAYNLLYLARKIWCFPRKFQGSYTHSWWSSGIAWYELSGGIITFNQLDFSKLTEEDISSEFQKVKL